MFLNSVAVSVTLLVGILLFHRQLRHSEQWRATVTPLPSIIGSGFLIVAPLLLSVMGKWALLGMVELSVFAYALGWVIRFNIANAEPYLEKHPAGVISRLENTAHWSLGIAYATSVAFYISLFTVFIFDRLGVSDPVAGK